MTEKEIMGLLNSIDDDLIDRRIDELMAAKGGAIDLGAVKNRAMGKIKRRRGRRRFGVALVAAAAVATLSAAYAGEISDALKSFFGKSAVYSAVVDGEAYYLPAALKLDDGLELLDASVHEGMFDITLRYALPEDSIGSLGISAVPLGSPGVKYIPSGYGRGENDEISLLLRNEAGDGYGGIVPFSGFTLTFKGKSYEVPLEKADGIPLGSLALGTEAPRGGAEGGAAPLIARVAAAVSGGNIQLVADFDDPDLNLSGFGEPAAPGFVATVENDGTGITSSSTSSQAEALFAYGEGGKAYELKPADGAKRAPVSLFTADAGPGGLRVDIPAVSAGYKKQVARAALPLPKSGKVELDLELDFIIQKAVIKTVERTSDDTVAVTLDMNTGGDKSVAIIHMGAYSSGVKAIATEIRGNEATMELTLYNGGASEALLEFSWPRYVIRGGWSVELAGE